MPKTTFAALAVLLGGCLLPGFTPAQQSSAPATSQAPASDAQPASAPKTQKAPAGKPGTPETKSDSAPLNLQTQKDKVSYAVGLNLGKGIHKEAVTISFPKSGTMDMYWQDGPQLSGWGEIISKYPDGTPAMVEGKSGNGWVILSGVHPEAPASWRTGLKFKTSVAADLAYAGTLITTAMNGTTLPHF